MNQQIRISSNDEVKGVLEFLKKNRYPVLSYPEIIRVVLSQAVTSGFDKETYPELTSDDLMKASSEFFLGDKDEVEYSEKDIVKPFTY